MNSFSEITISIPAYNDEKSLFILLEEIKGYLNGMSLNPSFFIIDDGSSDNTYRIAKKFQTENSSKTYIEVVRNSTNKGFGYTLNKVFTYPKTQWVLFLPGDNQFPAENIGLLLNQMVHAEFIIGWRKVRNDNLYRKLMSATYNKLISFIAKRKVRDVNSIVLFKRNLLDGVLLKSNSAFIHAELFLKCTNDCLYTEVEVKHQNRKYGKASGGKIRIVLYTIADFFQYILSLKIG